MFTRGFYTEHMSKVPSLLRLPIVVNTPHRDVVTSSPLLLFDPNKMYSQTEVASWFAMATAFTPPLKGSLGEVRKLEVRRLHADGITQTPFTLAIKRMELQHNGREDEILQEESRHLRMYTALSEHQRRRCLRFFTEPFQVGKSSKRGADGVEVIYTLQGWATQGVESILEFKSILQPAPHSFVSSDQLEELNSLTTAQVHRWLQTVATLLGRALRCIVDAGFYLKDLNARNVLLCFRGTVAAPVGVRLVIIDLASLDRIEAPDAFQMGEMTGVLTHIDVRFGEMSQEFFHDFLDWLQASYDRPNDESNNPI